MDFQKGEGPNMDLLPRFRWQVYWSEVASPVPVLLEVGVADCGPGAHAEVVVEAALGLARQHAVVVLQTRVAAGHQPAVVVTFRAV